ncbi:hypothetical protein GZH47_32935 (plasmid) [Paenibacillus rhizovicinus]|uniref:Uncharacterized protein n=1 Tax=Paenibacillus rhizovicinus TaxID=2704463 RepID=A0A6C0PAU2_9BACL|nr:hypothetical protein [Paenibacillus rhizovicinus]QHW35700.1 hypothetical protein GZH47_32935 [Paenibacillus rhizovicinus]
MTTTNRNAKKAHMETMKAQQARKSMLRNAIKSHKQSMKAARPVAADNPLATNQGIISAMQVFGIEQGIINRILFGIGEGMGLIVQLRDPALVAGLTDADRAEIERFVNAHDKLPAVVRKPKRVSVQVSKASVHKMRYDLDGMDIFSTLNYSDPGSTQADTGYQVIQENQLSELLASAPVEVVFTRNVGGEIVESPRRLSLMRWVHVVDMYVSLPEDEIDAETQELLTMQELMMRNGYLFANEDGEIVRANYLYQSASQARQLQGIFLSEECPHTPAEVLMMLGHDFLAYSKRKAAGVYELDITKMLKRFGLAGTSSIPSRTIDIGQDTVNLENGEYMIVGGRHTMMVIEDRYAVVKRGLYKVMDPKTRSMKTLDAAEINQTMAVGDGLVFCDEEVYAALLAEFGQESDAWQIRLTPFTKGLMVFVPDMRAIVGANGKPLYDANIVATKSAVKGDYRAIAKDFKIQLRVALFNKSMGQTKPYTLLPYQMTHGTSVTAKDLINTLDVHLNGVLDDMNDPHRMATRLGLYSIQDMGNDMTLEEIEAAEKKAIFNTHGLFLHHAPFTAHDAMMRRWSIELMHEQLEKWQYGSIPVEGHYRFMVQDPYAILNAGITQIRDDEGNLLVPENEGLEANTIFIKGRGENGKLEDITGQHVALGRNPMVGKEMQITKVAASTRYEAAVKKGGFRNLLVMSVHDFCTFAMGGADNDGDTGLTITENAIVRSVMKKPGIPVLDLHMKYDADGRLSGFGSGCPWSGDTGEVPSLEAPHVAQRDFIIQFTADQYTAEFRSAIHELSKEFVIRTLEPNKIGYMTNIATKLADAVRKIGYMIAGNLDQYGNKMNAPRNASAAAVLKSEIEQYESYIELLRLCQGWEIDRAKHGGAYMEQLAEELRFLKDPSLATFAKYKLKNGRTVWTNPVWLAEAKGKNGFNTNSVLSQVHAYVKNWKATQLDARLDEIMNDVDTYNVLTDMAQGIAIEPAVQKALEDAIRPIKGTYGAAIASAYDRFKAARDEALAQCNGDAAVAEELIELLEKERALDVASAVDAAQQSMTALEEGFDIVHIGYVAYHMTYANRRTNKRIDDVTGEVVEYQSGIGFPWTAAKRQFLNAARYVQFGNTGRTVLNEIKAGSFNMGTVVHTAKDAERMLDSVRNFGKVIVKYERNLLTKNSAYNIYAMSANGTMTQCGILYDSALRFLTGAPAYEVTVEDATYNGGHSVNMKVIARQPIELN